MRVVAVAVLLIALSRGNASADKVDNLIEHMREGSDLRQRLSAVLRLARVRDPRSIPALIKALSDPDKTVRGVAAASLGKLVDAKTDPEVRKEALEKLRELADKDENSFVRKQAEKAVRRIENPGQIVTKPDLRWLKRIRKRTLKGIKKRTRKQRRLVPWLPTWVAPPGTKGPGDFPPHPGPSDDGPAKSEPSVSALP